MMTSVAKIIICRDVLIKKMSIRKSIKQNSKYKLY